MKIFKILNNNAFISLNEKGEEIIVSGKGIAFNKSQGEEAEVTPGTKIFGVLDKGLNKRLEQILLDIPEEYLKVSERIVETLEKKYGKKADDIIYVTLTEHIHGAIERYHQNLILKNPMLNEIKWLFPDEFLISLEGLSYINEEFGIHFDEDEAAYIAQHLINAQLDGSSSNVAEIIKIMQEMLNVIKYTFKVELDEDSIFYSRFITHLKFFAQRIFKKSTYEYDNEELLDVLKEKYAKSYEGVSRIKGFLEKKYDYSLNSDEQLYLMIHIEKILTKALK